MFDEEHEKAADKDNVFIFYTVVLPYSHTLWDQKNGVIIKIIYDVIERVVFLISLLVTWD